MAETTTTSTRLSKSDAFFSASWCLSVPANTSGSGAPFASTSSLLIPPSPLLGRRASDSCLPPPCAGLTAGAPSAAAIARDGASSSSSTFRGRLASTGHLNIDVRPFQQPQYINQHPPLDRSRSCEPAASASGSSLARPSSPLSTSIPSIIASTSTAPNTIELRLEEAVRRLQETQQREVDDQAVEDNDDDDDDDMYYNDPEDAASTLKMRELPFSPIFPLEPLAVLYTPEHRETLSRPLKRALRILEKTQSRQERQQTSRRRKVNFAEEVEVVDVLAAVDYPERRGEPPIERLTMRDILELRQVKIELGVFGNNDPGDNNPDTPSTPFEKMNILESTPLSPSSASSLAPSSPFAASFYASEADSDEPSVNADNTPASTASSYQSSTPSSVSLSTSTSSTSTSCDASPSTCSSLPDYTALSPSKPSSSIIFLDPNSSHLARERETSPDSLLMSAFSSPSLSLSCSPSASESEYYYNGSNDDDDDPREENGDEDDDREVQNDRTRDGVIISRDQTPTKMYGKSDTSNSARATTARSKNADYFRIPLPVLSAYPPSVTSIDVPSSPSVPEVEAAPRSRATGGVACTEPIIVLDRPWGLEQS